MKYFTLFFCLFLGNAAKSQVNWHLVDSLYAPLPNGFHVYETKDSLDGKPNHAFYVSVNLRQPNLLFTTATSHGERLTPAAFYEREAYPLLVVNGSFFDFATHRNLNIVVKESRLQAHQLSTISLKGKDTLRFRHQYGSAIGIHKNREADIAWVITDSLKRWAYASQKPVPFFIDSNSHPSLQTLLSKGDFKKWKVETAIGGGPVLLQNGEIQISNQEENKFSGKAILDKHPRSAMGYTSQDKLIILLVEGRFPGKAEGATLPQLALLLKNLACIEALNLDGGGSSCMLINGKLTIQPSDKEGQRKIPGVFLIHQASDQQR